MKIVCAWCGKDMGEKPPYEDKSETHTICPECFAKQFPNISKEKPAADYWNQHLEHNALRSPPHGRGPDTDAGAFLAWMLEAAGDIIREMAKGYYIDSNYIFEKYNRLKNNVGSRDWTDPLSPRETEALGKIKKDIEGLPAHTELLGHLRKVLLAIAKREPKEIEQYLPRLRVILQQAIADARTKAEKEASPLILERFPYPPPEHMELGGAVGNIKVKIPPPKVVKPKEGSVIRTSEKNDKTVEHLGYHSVTMTDDEIASLGSKIPTDVELISESQKRLKETRIIPDEQLNGSQLGLLNLTRAIAEDVQCVPQGGIFAAVIPPASERVRTAGLYGTRTGVLYLSVDMLSRGRDAVDTHIHELAHHLQYIGSGEAEDLTPGHARAMTTIADRVIEGLGAGRYDRYLREIQY